MKIVLKCQIVPFPGVSHDDFGDMLALPGGNTAAVVITLDERVPSFFLHSGTAFMHLFPETRTAIILVARGKVLAGEDDTFWEFPVEMSLVQIEYLYNKLKQYRGQTLIGHLAG
jgi:hypothetical protein